MTEVFGSKLLAVKNALITGGGSGINFAIALRFAEQGAKIALIGRTKKKLDAAAAEISKSGGGASGPPAGVRESEALAAAINAAHETHGEIYIVVCGGAGNFPAPALGMSANGFKAVSDIDL